MPTNGVEENFKLKRTSLLSILAIVSATLLPLAATSQISPTRAQSADQGEHVYKYEVYAGYAYTSLNQVNESRYGLQGVNASVTRDWGRFFGVTAEGDYYKFALKSGNPGTPSVESVLFGPVLHANIYGHVGGFFHGLLGGEHTGGESQTPNLSFAGGVGGGLEYNLSPRLSLRATGDYIGASFSLAGNSAELGNSPHKTYNSRASFGAVYRF
jgi:opacity protein-like surface antigen